MNQNLTKILFELPKDNLGNYSTESVWAEEIGEHVYLLKNSPFYSYGYSFEDKVLTTKQGSNLPVVLKLIEPSGRSTYRLILNKAASNDDFSKHWLLLENIGCSYEEGTSGLYAVDVPASTDIYKAYELLELGESSGVWEFEEANCSHKVS